MGIIPRAKIKGWRKSRVGRSRRRSRTDEEESCITEAVTQVSLAQHHALKTDKLRTS